MCFDLEKKNFENLVYYYAARLKLIQKGNTPYKVLRSSERYNLQKAGILVFQRGARTLALSQEAVDLLNGDDH